MNTAKARDGSVRQLDKLTNAYTSNELDLESETAARLYDLISEALEAIRPKSHELCTDDTQILRRCVATLRDTRRQHHQRLEWQRKNAQSETSAIRPYYLR